MNNNERRQLDESDEKNDSAGSSAPEDANYRRQSNEIGGRKGLDPTRYGDWEKNGRCIDF